MGSYLDYQACWGAFSDMARTCAHRTELVQCCLNWPPCSLTSKPARSGPNRIWRCVTLGPLLLVVERPAAVVATIMSYPRYFRERRMRASRSEWRGSCDLDHLDAGLSCDPLHMGRPTARKTSAR